MRLSVPYPKDIPAVFPERDLDGGFIDSEGCWYEDEESFIQVGILGFCGCGDPSATLQLLLDAMELIEEKPAPVPTSLSTLASAHEAWNEWWPGHAARMDALLGPNDGIRYLVWYWMDTAGLTEHGGSVPGWLTERGKNLLALLRLWKAAQ